LRRQEPLRNGCTSTSLPLPHLCSRSGSRNSSQRSGSEGRSLGVILGIEPCPKNVNQFTIDIIGYILSQMPATCRRGDERQAAISINAGLRERSLFGQISDCWSLEEQPATYYRTAAARARILQADATTLGVRQYLDKMIAHCELLAGNVEPGVSPRSDRRYAGRTRLARS